MQRGKVDGRICRISTWRTSTLSDDYELLESKFGLTKRQAEILTEMRRGKRNGEIAESLGLSPRTVEKHVEQVLRKLEVRSRLQAVLLAESHLQTKRD